MGHDVEDTFSATLCKKCRTDPCACESRHRHLAVQGVCVACHRRLPRLIEGGECICASHASVRCSGPEPAATPTVGRRPYTQEYIERLANEFMGSFYYPRDAEGAVRWLRKYLS